MSRLAGLEPVPALAPDLLERLRKRLVASPALQWLQPTLDDLFAPTSSNIGTFTDLVTNTISTQVLITTRGNPNLTAEVGDTIAIKKIDANTTDATLKKAGKVVSTNRTVISKDGKTRTALLHSIDSHGKKQTVRKVYDRV